MPENTAVTTTEKKPALVAGGQVLAIIPQNIEQAFRLAHAIAASGMAPASLKSADQVMVAIMAGAELGLAPFQALQSFAVINGRPTLWGDGLVAIARQGGVTITETLEGEGDAMKARCVATRPSGEVIERTFSVADAKKANLWGKQGPWTQYPQRMLAARARAYALRDGCADMLRGFQVREEVEDYQPIRDVTPQTTGMRARLEARTAEGGFDADHVAATLDEAVGGSLALEHHEEAEFAEAEALNDEVFPGDTPAPATDDFDPEDWAASFNRGLAGFDTVADVSTAWSKAKANGFVTKLRAHSEAMCKALTEAVNARVAEINGAAD